MPLDLLWLRVRIQHRAITNHRQPCRRVFSLEYRKVTDLALQRYVICLKKLVPRFHPIKIKTKTKTFLQTFSRHSRLLRAFAWSVDWFTELSASFVIGQIANFGFGLTTLHGSLKNFQTPLLNGTRKIPRR